MLFSACDEENFTQRPGILHLHKTVKVDVFCVVFIDARRHKAHFVLQTRGAADDMEAMKPGSQLNCAAVFTPF